MYRMLSESAIRPRNITVRVSYGQKSEAVVVVPNRRILRHDRGKAAPAWVGQRKESAETRFHELMAKPAERVRSDSVKAICDLFLDWTFKHRALGTYLWYQKHLQSFLDSLKPSLLPADRLKAHHVDAWVDAHDWGPSCKRGAMIAVARAMNWAMKKGHIETNPIFRKLDKPAAGKRDVVLSPAAFKKLLAYMDGEFRDLVHTAWETGCRPQEITKVEARHVDLKNGRWVFPVEESKGKAKSRIVYLSKAALATTKRLLAKHPTGPLFRRPCGEPWSRHDVSQFFGRLKKKLGIHYRLYDLRHSFITNGLKNGVDPIMMANLVGHKDLKMIHTIYSHVSQDTKHMREAAMKAIAHA
jgi:integrase